MNYVQWNCILCFWLDTLDILCVGLNAALVLLECGLRAEKVRQTLTAH